MNSGTAVSAKWSIPSNRLSPSSESGNTPETISIVTAPAPITAQTGTPSAIRMTNGMTGP